MSELFVFQGEFAALGAAAIWAIAAMVYTQIGRQLSPLLLNLLKGLIAIALLLLTLHLRGQLFPAVPLQAVQLLALSGVVGIGFGDTAYFQALQDIGPRRTLVIEALAPPLTALLAWVVLRESLSAIALAGIALTILGVLWVVLERTQNVDQPRLHWLRGVSCGLLAALGQAAGAVLSRSALAGSDIDPLWSTLVRLVAGCAVLMVWLLGQRLMLKQLRLLGKPRVLSILVSTAFFSTYLGIWLQQVALKFASAGVAQSLSATSPLFVLPLAAMTGDRLHWRSILGVVIALAGIWLLFSRR